MYSRLLIAERNKGWDMISSRTRSASTEMRINDPDEVREPVGAIKEDTKLRGIFPVVLHVYDVEIINVGTLLNSLTVGCALTMYMCHLGSLLITSPISTNEGLSRTLSGVVIASRLAFFLMLIDAWPVDTRWHFCDTPMAAKSCSSICTVRGCCQV